MHDFHTAFLIFAATTTSTPTTSGNDNVKVAIVTALGVVFAAALTAFATTFQREKTTKSTVDAMTFTQSYIKSLEADRVTDRADLAATRLLYTKLRDACWEEGRDPDEMIRGQS